ncbi:phosphorylated ctd-interacting factor 1 [Chrysochromulina tobinii]|uniref:Phosphorylated ctd-interacting factor 1 n=1 Tax=Chrysochromulina tobinii TaxID=1460289 RepID=A0A0M0LNU3_9EUKA|nr:phosphorylated ctd-interacting factor 1 [Chrysochromulina tobinii]|eukprot:KOO52750.1 phosphorylated ctd-interacting factor 1 [Chrysochromulina sp. CCMP291]
MSAQPDVSASQPVCVRAGTLTRISNDYFEGTCLIFVRDPTVPVLTPGTFYRRYFEIQLQGRFKQAPERFFIGMELSEVLRLSMMARGISNTLFSFVRSYEPDIDVSFGSKDKVGVDFELPHLVAPLFKGCDIVVETPDGEALPTLGTDITGGRTHPKGGRPMRIRLDCTYTICTFSTCIDLFAWKVKGTPVGDVDAAEDELWENGSAHSALFPQAAEDEPEFDEGYGPLLSSEAAVDYEVALLDVACIEARLDEAAALALARGVYSESQWDKLSDELASGVTSTATCLTIIERELLAPRPIDVLVEVVRTECMLRLRKAFEREVVRVTGRPPSNEAMNAFIFVQLARSHSKNISGEWLIGEHLFVPLAAPSATAHGDSWPLIKYVERARERAEQPVDADREPALEHAVQLDAWLRQAWLREREKVLEAAAAFRRSPDEAAASAPAVFGAELPDGGFRVWLDPPPPRQRSEHRVNAVCVRKLRQAFRGSPAHFETRLFLLLHRYAALFGPNGGEGRGWQLATPPPAMDALTTDFGVHAECFASPMNRRQPRFCSAFSDTDVAFGSSGNFFGAARRGVLAGWQSAECGPPYDDELMEMAVEVLSHELSRREAEGSAHAGSFVLVVPDWRTSPPSRFWRAVQASPHLSRVLVLDKEAHRYVEGFQHQASSARTRFVQGETATLCIWMQNQAGRAAYPVTEEKLEKQREAWNLPPRLPGL